MGLGKLDLTINLKPNVSYLKKSGLIVKDKLKRRFYKNFCNLEFAQIFWQPHKFDALTNFDIPYTKVSIHPKYFDRFYQMKEYLFSLFSRKTIELDEFNISRIEIHSDIEDLFLDTVLARLWVMGYRRESVSFYKGNTIYIGTNPKVRIFNKSMQVLRKSLKGKKLSRPEQKILNSKQSIIRFSIEIGSFHGTLQSLVENPELLATYFDRFKFYNFECDTSINRLGGFQLLMSKFRREHRRSFEEFKQEDLEILLKENFNSDLTRWFKEKEQRKAIKKKPSFNLGKEVQNTINQLKKVAQG